MTALDEPSMTWAAPGRTLGRYRLMDVLGRGGMGTVYRARQAQLEKLVALKVLDPLRAGKQGAMTRFLREARAAAQIRHPHVVEVFDVGFDDGSAFLVMELLEGHDLAAHLAARGRLELSEALDIMAPVLAGVRAAHEAGVVHRDLKPSNVFLARRGRTFVDPVVLDFGVSRILDDQELGAGTLTSADALVGTAAYIAPEQAREARLADDRSDQYALAVILYECVTGERPFRGANTYELLHAIATADIEPPSRHSPRLPPGFDEVLLKALSRDPERRFGALDEFAGALLPFASPRTRLVWGGELASAVEPPDAHRSSSPRRSWLGAFALGAFTSGSLSWWLAPHRAEVAPARESRPVAPASPVVSHAPAVAPVPPVPAMPSPSTSFTGPSPPLVAPRAHAPKPARPPEGAARTPVELGPNDAPILE